MFVNGVPFLVCVARGQNLVIAEFIPSCTAKQLATGITCIMELYPHSGFQVGTVLMDNEFDAIKNLVPILAINRNRSGRSGWGCRHTGLACTRTAGRSRHGGTVRGDDGRATDEQHCNFLSCFEK
jgi:hypothetical protein